MDACHTGMSREMSKMLPMRGCPFGPGGYDGLLSFCHFQNRAKDALAQSDAASRVSLFIMLRGKRRRGSADMRATGSHPFDPGFILG